ncbi:anti-sigma regulatory factor (Ser/Thr protein kinase) [Streptomyces sp. B3I8]|nr:anti-sigma regulatory factor (Ser/Thr protein kinase) [Streptomyces sp. B3I8]
MLTEVTTPDEEPRTGTGLPVPAEQFADVPVLAERYAATPRGARLARRRAVRWMEERGHPSASDASCAVALVVGELAANAVRHGRVPGRDFGLRLAMDEAAGLVRVEVADADSAHRPPAVPPAAGPEDESGRGLLLVDVLATRWGSAPREPVGKTVWAEVPAVPVADGPDAYRRRATRPSSHTGSRVSRTWPSAPNSR